MLPETRIYECYCHGKTDRALVAAQTREYAQLICQQWLGWDVVVAFIANDQHLTWKNNGGSQRFPIVLGIPDGTYQLITQPTWEDANVTH